MLARFTLKRLAVMAALLGLPVVLFWLVSEDVMDGTMFAVLSLVSLILVMGNLWEQQRVNRQAALDEVDVAREHMDKSQYRAALNRLEEAIKIDPACFEIRIARGEIYRCEQAYDHARKELVEAISLRPDSFRAHFALGLTYLQEKKVFEAISEFRRTIQLKPDFGESYFILAQAYELAGEKGKALASYRDFLKVVANDEGTNKKITDYVERSHSRILALQ